MLKIIKATCLVFALSLMLSNTASADEHKTNICHKPDKDNMKILSIDSLGVADHLGHGDHEVTGEMCDSIPDNDCDGVAGTAEQNHASCNDYNDATDDSCEVNECVNEESYDPTACPAYETWNNGFGAPSISDVIRNNLGGGFACTAGQVGDPSSTFEGVTATMETGAGPYDYDYYEVYRFEGGFQVLDYTSQSPYYDIDIKRDDIGATEISACQAILEKLGCEF